MSTSSTPAVPIVVGLDDELLYATHLLPVATVAAIANAGHWHLLRYYPQARELRLNPGPGPGRTPHEADYRVDVQISDRAGVPPALAGALFTCNPPTEGRPSA